jgi:hypothetical protein
VQRCFRYIGQSDDSDPSNLDPSRQYGWCPSQEAPTVATELNLIVGNEPGAAIDQTQRQIRFAGARRSPQQNPPSVEVHTGAVHQ